MKCLVETVDYGDICGLIRRETFFRLANPEDLACRESDEVENWYRKQWFEDDDDGERHFTPPAFQFREGELFGINGRHRAILLSRHMDPFPMILVLPGPEADALFERVLCDGDPLELPPLPMRDIPD